jgi:hypothetical protein
MRNVDFEIGAFRELGRLEVGIQRKGGLLSETAFSLIAWSD